MKRFLLLGASRGLGWQCYLNLSSRFSDSEFLLVSRKIELKQNQFKSNTTYYTCDFSKMSDVENSVEKFKSFNPTHMIYFAGGGPYGFYETQKWNSHLWSFQVNFLTPAFYLHQFMLLQQGFDQLKSVIMVGSAIAESNPDIKAASYAASKHALKGLVTTLQKEIELKKESLSGFDLNLELFSPGYFKSDLLPVNSAPRELGLAEDVELVAQKLIEKIN